MAGPAGIGRPERYSHAASLDDGFLFETRPQERNEVQT